MRSERKALLRWQGLVGVGGLVAAFGLAVGLSPATGPPARVLRVQPGESIQAAVDRAQPGDTIEVLPGVYREAVVITKPGLTLKGLVQGDRRPVLDGQGRRDNGVWVRPPEGEDRLVGFALSGFEVRHYRENGVFTERVDQVVLRDVRAIDTGEYGLYAVLARDVLIEASFAQGASDAGLYVGQAEDAVVRANEATGNVAGIEIENTDRALVVGNRVQGNSGGILVFALPFLERKTTTDVQVLENRVEANNLPNFAPPGELVATVPAGTGILVLAADRTEVARNTVRGNDSFGIGLGSYLTVFEAPADRPLDIEPQPDENRIAENVLEANGRNPGALLAELHLPGVDLLWDLMGRGNCWEGNRTPQGGRPTTFPSFLPRCR